MNLTPCRNLSPISVGLIATFGLLATPLLSAAAVAQETDFVQATQQPIQELAVTKVDEQTSDAAINELSPIDIRVSLRSDLSEALSLIPSVRVDNTASSSLQQGDIQPAEFSIRGAAPYQNNIQLDNASIDSFLDPANKLRSGGNPSRTQVAGHSQSVFIDPEFLSNIRIIDKNASAREGGFTGGVVKAETQSYEGKDTFAISHRLTKDDWTEFHIDENQLDEFGDGAAQTPTGLPGEFQPNFKKSETSVKGATRLGNVGLFAGFSEKRSEITQKRASVLAILHDFDYFLETGNVFKRGENTSLDSQSRFLTVRADLLDAPYELYATVAYSTFKQDSFQINFIDSDFTSNNEGLNLSVNYNDNFSDTRMESNVSINLSNNERDAKLNSLDNYNGRDFTTQASFIGGFGSLKSDQKSLSSKVDFVTPIAESVDFLYGIELKHLKLKQERLDDFVDSDYFPENSDLLNGRGGAVPYEDHLLTEEITYAAGTINFNSTNLAVYGEFEGAYDQFFYSVGARGSRDDFLGNVNIAHRLSGGMFIDQEQTFKVEIGANRYYGKSFLTYRLRDEERKFVTERKRAGRYDPASPLITTAGEDRWLSNDLDTPYDNEFALSFSKTELMGTVELDFVLRQGKDQIRTFFNTEDRPSQYQNTGSSESKQIGLLWRSERFNWAATNWTINSGLSWSDLKTDAQYLEGGYGNIDDPLEDVIFEGKQVRRAELPADDFATPLSANIDIVTQAFADNLLIINSFRMSNGYQYLDRSGSDEDTGLDVYEVKDQGSTFNWDLTVQYNLETEYGSPYVKLEAVNITDRQNVIRFEQGSQLFGLGRQFWLEVGYEF